MKTSDSLEGVISICSNPTDERNQENNPICTRDFETLLEGLDEEVCIEESGHKKRRLRVDQVKALEKHFEVENKLEPERKVELAQELDLQPRQVAVWFQNRRARWKTKQLERDYGIMKDNYDALKKKWGTLNWDNDALLKEILELKSKLGEGGKTGTQVSVKEEAMTSDTHEEIQCETQINSLDKSDEPIIDFGASLFLDFKDGGSSDSTTDSSAIFNEENNSPTQFLEIIQNRNFKFQDSNASASVHENAHKSIVKIEEHNFLAEEEESCSTLFCDDQAPTLHWYCSGDWI